MNADSDRKYLIAFAAIALLNPKVSQFLAEQFMNLPDLFQAKRETLTKLKVPEKIIALIKNPNWDLIDQSLAWAEQEQHHIVALTDPDYPPLLKETVNPPFLLFIAGNKALLSTPQLAIVGSRNPTHNGKENAFAFAKQLSLNGLTIVSGGAAGIDAAAHAGALAANAGTIAVMGTGLDQIYPKTNIKLAQNILEQGGTLVSEFLIGTPPLKQNFPMRNRIISGLSFGTLIVEATTRSGSLITARLAGEQNREIFAIPGSIHNPLAHGCHALIRQGAKLVETAQDIFSELKHVINPRQFLAESDFDDRSFSVNKKNILDPAHKKLLECIEYEPTIIDVIAERSELKITQVASILLMLELDGYIANTAGGYVRIKS
jgi:DNA processing protein